MARYNRGSKYIFCIDTTEYAGNFERAMFWYMTGVEPEYMHGGVDWIGPLAQQELANSDLRGSVVDKLDHEYRDETGCARPVEIVQSPKSQDFNSVGVMFGERPTKDELDHLKKRALDFNKLRSPKPNDIMGDYSKIKILGFRLLEVDTRGKEIDV